MKKMRKIFAVLLTLAMVLGMSMTSFAAGQITDSYKNSITVTNLAQGVKTNVSLVNIIYLNDNNGNQEWTVVDWAKNYIEVDKTTGNYKIKSDQKNALKDAAKTQTPFAAYTGDTAIEGTNCTFNEVPIGAYVVVADDTAGVYGLMVTNTYDRDGKVYMASKAANVSAKLEQYNVNKTASDKFVHRGQTVTFTISTQMAPKSNEAGAELKNFTVKDKPVNLKITDLKSVSISGTPISAEQLAALPVTNTINPTTGCTTEYVVDLSSLITATPAGVTVEITYDAIVMSDTDYSNEATVTADTVTYEKDNTNGTEGAITIKKTDNNHTGLKGAEFKLLKAKSDETTEEVSVVKVSDGVYKHALEGETGATTTMVVANDGTLLIKGLDEGTYSFQETKAPEGYKLVTDLKSATIEDGHTATVDAGEFVNTKLSALPSTGGIGTTIFTIAGCVIMIAAAGLFFASRKKSDNK